MFPCVGTPMLYPGRRCKRKWILVAGCQGVMAFGDLICVPNGSNADAVGGASEEEEEIEGDDVIVEEESLDFIPPPLSSANREEYQILTEEDDDEESRRKIDIVVRLTIEREQMIATSAASRISEKNYERAVAVARLRRRSSTVPNRYSKKFELNLNLVPWLTSVVDVENVSTMKCLLDKCGEWQFDAFVLSRLSGGHPVISLGCKLIELYQFADVFRLEWTTLYHCLSLIESGYNSNPYHNAIHAADVAQALHCFLQEPPVAAALNPLEKMACIMAALGHDLCHPGVNQKFLESSQHHLCKLYKVSVLENFHWRCLISIFVETSAFSELSSEEWHHMLAIVQVLILATDMQRQQEYLDEFKQYLDCDEMHLSDPSERLFIMQILIKCADIANPCRPWTLSKEWSLRASEEFFNQGDLERRLGLPVTGFCDRMSTTVPKIQAGFMEYVAQPLFADWHQFMSSPLSREMLTNLQTNTMHWLKIQDDSKHAKRASEALLTESASPVVIRLERSSRSSVDDMAELETQTPEILLKRRASSSAALLLSRGGRRTSMYDEQHRRVSLPAGYSSSTLWTASAGAGRRLYQALSVGQLSHQSVSLHLSETEPILHETSPEEHRSPPYSSHYRSHRRSVDVVTFDLPAPKPDDDDEEEECAGGHCPKRKFMVGDDHSSFSLQFASEPGGHPCVPARPHGVGSGQRRFSEPAVVVPLFPSKMAPKLMMSSGCYPRRGSLPMTQKELEVFRMVGSTQDMSDERSGSGSTVPTLGQPIGAW